MTTHTPSRRSRRPPRRAMTVVEVLVALVLVAIGLLGIAGSTALALRSARDASQRRGAVHRIVSRHSQLTAAGCSGATSGVAADSARALTESWYVAVQASGFAIITDSVKWMGPRGPHAFALSSAFPC